MATTEINLSKVSPKYAAAVAKAGQLAERANQINARLGSIGADICQAQAAAFDRSAQGRELLEADDLDVALAAPVSTLLAGLEAERNKLGTDRERIAEARELMRQEVAEARREASAVVCRDLLPEYRVLAGALVDAVLAAHQAQVAIDAFTCPLCLAEVGWVSQLHPVGLELLRNVGHSDQLPVWLRECRRFGLTKQPDPPRWLELQKARVW